MHSQQLLVLVLCCAVECGGLKSPETGPLVVDIHTSTVHEINGVAAVPKVFGLTAYSGASDFVTDDGVDFIKRYNVDTIGLGDILGTVLPQSPNTTLNTSQLASWLQSPQAKAQYQSTAEYAVLSSRGIRKGGAVPFIFLKNPDGSCTPDCEEKECYPTAGTPLALNATTPQEEFAWWSTLFAGFLNLCIETDPAIGFVHIWNEPNAHFWKDGKNGSYYAEFYTAVVMELKKRWPNVKYGGPVTWDPPNGPFSPPAEQYTNWADYTLPLLDTAIDAGVLDYVDFHAYLHEANPESLLSSIQTTSAYTQVHYHKSLPVAITETNYNLNDAEVADKRTHFYNRTFPLVLSTFALLRNPDSVISRLIFDYKANVGGTCNCAFVSGPVEDLYLTQETNIYYLLGKLSNGTRLYTDYSSGGVRRTGSQCKCFNTKPFGSSSVLVEAALVGRNITVALVNPCNCTTSLTLRFQESNSTKVLASWAAVFNVDSLKEVKAPAWPMDDITLPPLSLLVATYQIPEPAIVHSHPPAIHKAWQSSTSQVRKQTTYPPVEAASIMQSIPVDVPCNYSVVVHFNTSQAEPKPNAAILRFSILGKPGNETWMVTFLCGTQQMALNVEAPGVFVEVKLPCVPAPSSEGLTELNFKSVTCSWCHTKPAAKTDKTVSQNAYFASVVLAMETTVTK